MTAAADTLKQQLVASLVGQLGSGVRIEDARPLSGGASRETWSFDAVAADGTRHPLILRRDPPSSLDGTVMQKEIEAILAAEVAGVPVPQILVASIEREPFGRPAMIMERISGEALPSRIFAQMDERGDNVAFVQQCATILAELHAASLDSVEHVGDLDVLGHWQALQREFGPDRPVLAMAARWLAAHSTPTMATTLVHGDFRMGNLLVEDGRVTAVLDWELVHTGDPLEDLGWFCTKAWRFGRREPVGGLGSYELLHHAYVAAGGVDYTPAQLHWWEVMSTFKWAMMCLQQYRLYTSGTEDSLELASLAWRTWEAEWDLLYLLTGDAPRADEWMTAERCEDSDGPSTTAVLRAVEAAVRNDLLPGLKGRERFIGLVTAKLVGAAAADSSGAAARRSRIDARITSTGHVSVAALAEALGERAPTSAEIDLLRDLVGSKLAMVNPRYLGDPFPTLAL